MKKSENRRYKNGNWLKWVNVLNVLMNTHPACSPVSIVNFEHVISGWVSLM